MCIRMFLVIIILKIRCDTCLIHCLIWFTLGTGEILHFLIKWRCKASCSWGVMKRLDHQNPVTWKMRTNLHSFTWENYIGSAILRNCWEREIRKEEESEKAISPTFAGGKNFRGRNYGTSKLRSGRSWWRHPMSFRVLHVGTEIGSPSSSTYSSMGEYQWGWRGWVEHQETLYQEEWEEGSFLILTTSCTCSATPALG